VKILAIQFRHLGDAALMTPALRLGVPTIGLFGPTPSLERQAAAASFDAETCGLRHPPTVIRLQAHSLPAILAVVKHHGLAASN
jgi:hypothetical protein